MGRRPCCSKEGLNRGAWTAMEDKLLKDYITVNGEGKWRNLPKRAGLQRCGKSCRLRWLNYLRPDIKRGNITRDEEDLIIRLHKLLGNRWSLIAGRLPGRTDNEIKNYWNTNISKKVKSQPNFPTSKCKSKRLNVSQQKSSERTKRSRGQKSSPTLGSPTNVVRTKASRCTKVFITSKQQINQETDTKQAMGPTIDDDTAAAEPQGPVNVVSPFIVGEEDPDPYDLTMDFEMDDNFLSDFLENEFEPLSDLLGVLEGDNNTNTSNETCDSFPYSNQMVSISEAMLHASGDLGSMEPFLDAEVSWLQD